MIFDFDGTLTRLDIDWNDLRSRLGIGKISELWGSTSDSAWNLVTEAEIIAARSSSLNQQMAGLLQRRFVVLSNNSEQAIKEFFTYESRRNRFFPERLIIGRETLAGPKENADIFDTAICLALNYLKSPAPATTYYGDQAYEIEYAKRLGLSALTVAYPATT